MNSVSLLDASNPNHPHQAKLLKETDAAAYLSVSVKTLQGWRWQGQGPAFVKIGRAVRYRVQDLADFVGAGIRTSTTVQ